MSTDIHYVHDVQYGYAKSGLWIYKKCGKLKSTSSNKIVPVRSAECDRMGSLLTSLFCQSKDV